MPQGIKASINPAMPLRFRLFLQSQRHHLHHLQQHGRTNRLVLLRSRIGHSTRSRGAGGIRTPGMRLLSQTAQHRFHRQMSCRCPIRPDSSLDPLLTLSGAVSGSMKCISDSGGSLQIHGRTKRQGTRSYSPTLGQIILFSS